MSSTATAITAGEWFVSPGERYAPYHKWSCTGCHVGGWGRETRDEAREEAAEHVRATGHTVTVSTVSEEVLHGMAVR